MKPSRDMLSRSVRIKKRRTFCLKVSQQLCPSLNSHLCIYIHGRHFMALLQCAEPRFLQARTSLHFADADTACGSVYMGAARSVNLRTGHSRQSIERLLYLGHTNNMGLYDASSYVL